MFKRIECRPPRCGSSTVKVSRSLAVPRLLAVSLFLFGVSMVALPVLAAPLGANPEQAEAVLEQLRDRYEVLPLSDGYLLRPIAADIDFKAIEVKAGKIAVDGEPASRQQLEELVGDDASILFELSALGENEEADQDADGGVDQDTDETSGQGASEGEDDRPAAEDLRRSIERLAEERKLRSEDIEKLIRERVGALEDVEEGDLEAIGEELEKEQRSEQRRRRRGRIKTDTRVSFGSSLTIEENETSEDVVVLGGSLDVEGNIQGDAVIVAGSAEIQGEISGSVTAVGGSIFLGPEGRIYGDAISIGGAVQRDPSAEIYGEITEVSLGPGLELDDLWHGLWSPDWRLGWFDFGLGALITRVSKTVMLGVLLLLILLLFPRFIAGVAERVGEEPWKAGAFGLGVQLLFLFAFPVVFFILMVTIVGIPLALLLAPLATLAMVVLFLLGFAGVACAGGHLLQERFRWQAASPYLLLIVGLALVQGWSILGEALGVLGGPIKVLGWLVLLLGFVIKYVAWTIGLGAVLLHRFSPRAAVGTLPGPPSPLPPLPSNWGDTAFESESSASSADTSSKTLVELREEADRYPSRVDEMLDLQRRAEEDEEYLRAAVGDASEPDDSEAGDSEGDDSEGDDSEADDSEADDSADADSGKPSDGPEGGSAKN